MRYVVLKSNTSLEGVSNTSILQCIFISSKLYLRQLFHLSYGSGISPVNPHTFEYFIDAQLVIQIPNFIYYYFGLNEHWRVQQFSSFSISSLILLLKLKWCFLYILLWNLIIYIISTHKLLNIFQNKYLLNSQTLNWEKALKMLLFFFVEELFQEQLDIISVVCIR